MRPVPLEVHIQGAAMAETTLQLTTPAGFAGKHYCPRMASMNKPTYQAILTHSPTKPTLVFVSSRRQTRLTAIDLMSFCGSEVRH